MWWLVASGVLVVIFFLWRYSSKRYVIPCPPWLSKMVEYDNPFAYENKAKQIIEHLSLTPSQVVMDLGCGPGRVTIPLAKHYPECKVVAADISEEMLAKVKIKATMLDNVEYLKIQLSENPLGKDQYDCILLVNVLGEIPNQKAAFKDIFCALKPSGVLSVSELIFDPHFQSISHIRGLAEEVGFIINAVYGSKWVYTIHLQKP